MPVKPVSLAHVVLRTRRFALVDLSVVDPNGAKPESPAWVGVDHLAWTLASLDDFRQREVHEPVSPIRGAISAIL